MKCEVVTATHLMMPTPQFSSTTCTAHCNDKPGTLKASVTQS